MSNLKPDIESAKLEITRLENKVAQLEKYNEMLVMYNGNLNKLKADAVWDLKEWLGDYLTAVDLSDTAVIYIEEYADKLERGDV